MPNGLIFKLYYTAGIFPRKWKQIFVKNFLGNTRNSISSIQTNSCYDSSRSTGWLIRKKWNVIPCGETIEIPVFPGQRPELGDHFRILNALVTKFMWTQEAENAQVPPPVASYNSDVCCLGLVLQSDQKVGCHWPTVQNMVAPLQSTATAAKKERQKKVSIISKWSDGFSDQTRSSPAPPQNVLTFFLQICWKYLAVVSILLVYIWLAFITSQHLGVRDLSLRVRWSTADIKILLNPNYMHI